MHILLSPGKDREFVYNEHQWTHDYQYCSTQDLQHFRVNLHQIQLQTRDIGHGYF